MDKVIVYSGSTKQWAWQRRTEDGIVIADSWGLYADRTECTKMATRVNAHPYVLEVQIGNELIITDTAQGAVAEGVVEGGV